jgi:chemotaxis receptor (MCP) glutamine deamidase CheD
MRPIASREQLTILMGQGEMLGVCVRRSLNGRGGINHERRPRKAGKKGEEAEATRPGYWTFRATMLLASHRLFFL